jgi:RNA polymerase sigma-70 factor (ECF subfamily)
LKAWELEKCIDEFGTDIYRFCMKLCIDKGNAEDLYQQTFLKALEGEMELDWEQNPKALFFSIAYKLWKSEQRKNARRFNIAPCVNLDETNENSLRSEENIEESIFRQELITEISKIIENLPEKIRVPLTLFYLFEQPVDEIAKEIKKPPGTVKSRLFKGRGLIKKKLEELGYGK